MEFFKIWNVIWHVCVLCVSLPRKTTHTTHRKTTAKWVGIKKVCDIHQQVIGWGWQWRHSPPSPFGHANKGLVCFYIIIPTTNTQKNIPKQKQKHTVTWHTHTHTHSFYQLIKKKKKKFGFLHSETKLSIIIGGCYVGSTHTTFYEFKFLNEIFLIF